MSGTSLDGVDGAAIQIRLEPFRCKFLGLQHRPYPAGLRRELLNIASGAPAISAQWARLNRQVAMSFAGLAERLCQKLGLSLEHIDFIGSHGQTIFHGPDTTLQIGDGSLIAGR